MSQESGCHTSDGCVCVCVYLHHLNGVLRVAHLRGGDGGVVGVRLQAAHVGRVSPVAPLELSHILRYFIITRMTPEYYCFYIDMIIFSFLQPVMVRLS